MTDLVDRLTTALADRYRIERELGRGGMATVYLSRDLKHGREVAVKVLHPELAATLGAERFLREIQIAASLTHPHILTLIDSGKADGFLFYVMPYIEGESLRDRLNRERQLPLDDAIRIAGEVARALSHAHDHGVLHRDIKPENILLSAGEAVVADFGIARAINAAGGEQLTETGLAIGTPAYMSPEQGAGSSELDERSDIYSLGCVLYEMLGGEPPYTGPTPQAVIAKRLSEPVPHISTLRDSVPPPLEATINKALAKAPVDRFAMAIEFAEALTAPAPPLPERRWGPKHWVGAVLGATAAAAAALMLTVQRPRGPVSRDELPRIAVLPFENLGAPEDDFFADGITEEITSRLAEISGLRVVSRTSAMRYRDHEMEVQEIGRELDVAYLLEGTIRSDRAPGGAGQVRVTPQLIRVADDVHLWTQRYDAGLTPGEILQVQAEIAEQVTGALNVTLLEPERRAIAAYSTSDAEAYNEYLLGRFHKRRRTPEALRLAAEHFARAIARDSTFARAYAALADTYHVLVLYGIASVPDSAAYARAEQAARRAVALDPTLAAPHASLARSRWLGWWDWAEAAREYQRALTLDPDDMDTHASYQRYLHAVGRVDEAEDHGRRAVALDPVSAHAHNGLGLNLYYQRRADEARVEFLKAAELEPAWRIPHFNLMKLNFDEGRFDDTAREGELAGFPPEIARLVVPALTGQTSPEVVARLFDQIERADPLVTPAFIAQAYSRAGLIDSAFANLEQALRIKDGRLQNLKSDPWFDAVRSDPRYADILRQMGLER